MKYVALALCALFFGCNEDTQQTQQVQPQVTASIQPKILFIGDSITQRWNTERDFPGSINVGIGGQRTCEMWNRFDRDVLAYSPDILVILGGINDISLDSDPSPLCIYLMVQAAEAHNIRVIVGTLLPDEFWSGSRAVQSTAEGIQKVLAFNDALRAGASVYGYTLVDYFPAFLKDGKEDTSLYVDGVHPNEAGYALMVPLLIQSIGR